MPFILCYNRIILNETRNRDKRMRLDETLRYLQKLIHTNEQYREYIYAEMERGYPDTGLPICAQKDHRSWCYFCDDLLGRASVFIALTGDKRVIQWTRESVLWITEQDAAEWIGPNLPHTTPLVGSLATAHISRGVSYPLLLCPEIFSKDELKEIQDCLKSNGLDPIERYLQPRIDNPTKSRNNWCIIELSGAMFTCMALGDLQKLHSYIPFYNLLQTDYNSDFYGETVGYWNYSFSGFYSIHLMCSLICPEVLSEMANIQNVMRPFVWAYYHRQGLFKLQNFDRMAYRALTFGDCNTIWEVKPDTLLYIALYHEDEKIRALAAECFLEPHTDQGDDIPTFSTMILLPFLKEYPKDTSFLPPARLFGDGYLMYKNAWDNPSIQIALKTGVSEIPKTAAHHHADELSFQLSKDGVVILDDPSRCCYRLALQALSASAKSHSVPSFTTEDGEELLQTATLPKLYRKGKYNRLENARITDQAFFAISEASDLYPDEITKLRRIFVGVGDHILIIKDEYEAKVPVFETVSFIGNNRRNQMTAKLLTDGGSLAREGVGVKIQSLQPTASALESTTLHDRYMASEDSPYLGCDGSGYILRIKSTEASTEGRQFYVVFADKEKDLPFWKASRKGNTVLIFKNEKIYYTINFTNSIKILENNKDLLF